ncbi:MAG: hypothetical protein HYY40_04290 [Bacteroidetes bacterium]|nr:hypothetical protein [Bacteroidota bacterium]
MRYVLIIFLICLNVVYLVYSQDSTNEKIDSIKIYLISSSKKYQVARIVDNFKEFYIYKFETAREEIDFKFWDYKEFTANLQTQKKISNNDDGRMVIAFVELSFDNKVVELMFDHGGNYYFMGSWYERHDGLYYNLFKYFSDELINAEVLLKAKSGTHKHGLWGPNE